MNSSLLGATLAGKYEIQTEIGRGGMGIVYRGYDVMLRRAVAVKVLPLEYTYDQQFVDRFRQEAVTAAGLHHTGIVTIYDVGQQGQWHYIVMQLLDGMTLDQWLLKAGPLPIPKIAQIVKQLGAALDYAHQAAIVHRDIKPSNIMIGPDGHATLMDFGLVHAGEGGSLTRSGVVIGTPEYMAPEQVLGEPVDGRTDLYSLGVVIYRMLTGQAPFVRSSSLATAHAQVYDPPPPLRILRSDVPKSIEAVVSKALAKRPNDRYQLGAKLSADLDLAASGKMPPGLKGIDTPTPLKGATKAPRVGSSKNSRSSLPEARQDQPRSPKPGPLPSEMPANDAATVVLKPWIAPTALLPPENTVIISRQSDEIRAPMVDNPITQQLQTAAKHEVAPQSQQTIKTELTTSDDANPDVLPQAVSTSLRPVSEPGREPAETTRVVTKERPIVSAPDRPRGNRLVWIPVGALFVVMISMVVQGGRAAPATVTPAPIPTILTDSVAEQVSAQQTSDQAARVREMELATRTAIAQAATSTADAESTAAAEATLSFIHATRTAAARAVATEVAAIAMTAPVRATRTAAARAVSTEVAVIKATAAVQSTRTAATAIVRAKRLAATATAMAKLPRATVWANQDWQDSGISVQAGDTLVIRYRSGAWSSWSDSLGPPPASGHSDGIVPTVSWTGLIGRIESGPPFAIGSEARVVASSGGRLFLRINDTDTRDNTGSIVVLIEVIRPPP